MSAITGVAAEAGKLTAHADALRAKCEALAGSTQDEASRATLARAANRLSSSVVRPLTAALQSIPEPGAADPVASAADLPHQLHLLAAEATGCVFARRAPCHCRRQRRRSRTSPARRSPTTLSASRPGGPSWRR